MPVEIGLTSKKDRLKQAIGCGPGSLQEIFLRNLFAWFSKGLVYPQIWEDPEVDMAALAITPDCHVVAISSGGCNILSYLTANPQRIFIAYSLSMIPQWRSALAKAISLLVTGSELHVVDFGGQEGLPGWFRSAVRNWLTLFDVTPRDDLELTLTKLVKPGRASLLLERPYRGYSQLAVLKKLRD
jgi:hypothetical protein